MESRNRHRRKLRVADAFAQMLVYGLFLAKLNAKPNDKITLENARTNVPGSFRLIRELVSFLDELEKDEYVEIRWVIEEVLLIVNELDIGRIHDSPSAAARPSTATSAPATRKSTACSSATPSSTSTKIT